MAELEARVISREALVLALEDKWRAARAGELSRKETEANLDPRWGLGSGARVRLLAILHGSIGDFQASLELSKEQTGPRPANDDTRTTVVQWLAASPFPTLDEATLFTTRFVGANAVRHCLRWLETGYRPLADDTTLLPPRPFHPSEARQDLLEIVQAFLEKDTLQPIMTVVGDGMSEGLRAFASHLCEELAKQAEAGKAVLPVVYLPVTRDPLTQEKISFARLVGYLAAYYRRQVLRDTPTPASTHAIREDLRFVRRMMAKEPCTIILDGWAAFTGSLPKLGSLMSDDGLSSLIDEIVHPDRTPGKAVDGSLTYHKNRIIVLAATTVRARNPFVQKEESLPPPLKTQMAEIATGQGRPSSLVAIVEEMKAQRTDVALALAEFIHDKPEAGGPAAPDLALLRGDEQELAASALAIVRTRPLAHLALAAVALMPDGMRIETLERVLERWREAAIASPLDPAWTIKAFDVGNLKSAASWLGPMLSRGKDCRVVGLDGVEARRERRDFQANVGVLDSSIDEGEERETWDPVDPKDPTWDQERLWVDFAAPRLRTLVAEHLASVQDQRAIARLHRLLAEEALNQHNLIIRHGDWHDADDIRFYRRLLQAIYHGACSLALGPAARDFGLKAVAGRALPSTPTLAYVRLYAVLYRALLEAPPEWGLSRILGRDDVKVDLLRLMINVDSKPTWRMLEDPLHLAFEPPGFLSTTPAKGLSADVAIAIDQFTSLAKAALRNNELGVAGQAIAAGLKLAEPLDRPIGLKLPTTSWTPAKRLHLALAKLEIEHLVLGGEDPQLGTARKRANAYLTETFGFKPGWLKDLKLRAPAAGAAEPLEGDTKIILEQMEAAIGDGWSSETLSAWSDLLDMVAEIEVIEAEHRAPEDVDRPDQFMLAYVLLLAGDRLRRKTYDLAPLSRDFHLNPHGTRVMIRTLLHLIKEARKGEKDDTAVPQARSRALIGQARRQLDVLTRYVARYPTERPSLLILEAALARQVGANGLEDLRAAERLLAEADDLMTAAAHRPRVRLRLLRERAQVYRNLARRSPEGPEQEAYVDLAYIEADRLQRLAEHSRLELWKRVAKRQFEKVDDLVADGKLPRTEVRGLKTVPFGQGN